MTESIPVLGRWVSRKRRKASSKKVGMVRTGPGCREPVQRYDPMVRDTRVCAMPKAEGTLPESA